ncbi:hypothetical protein N183_19475 [Sinorhizobium sp. Sb3]|nr:hypothetical protein N183_19475 [Sinorhizobium sp. Sb3]
MPRGLLAILAIGGLLLPLVGLWPVVMLVLDWLYAKPSRRKPDVAADLRRHSTSTARNSGPRSRRALTVF